MADPFTISMAAAGGGSLINAFGKFSEGQSQAGMYGYQSGVAQLNKQIALQNAEYAIRAGETEARQTGMKTRFDVGRIKTAKAAGNLDITSGSAADVVESRGDVGRMDMGIIRENAGRRAYGFMTEAAGEEAKSEMYKKAGSNAKTAGMIGALGSLVSGAASVSSKWMQWKSVSGNEGNYLSPDSTPLGY